MDSTRGMSPALTVNVEGDFDPALLRQALHHLEKAVALDPANARYRRVLAEALLAARRFDSALVELRRLGDLRREPRLQYLIAHCLYRLGEHDEAQRVLDAATVQGALGFSRAHILRGRILFERGKFAEAMNEFSHALDLDSRASAPKWHMARALVAHAQTTLGDATNLYRRAFHLLTNYTPTVEQFDDWHHLLGRVHLALHHPVEALEHLERLQRDRVAGDKSLLLGFCYLLRGNTSKALELLTAAVRDPDLRARCTDYLCEVVSTPRDQLLAMGLPREHASVVGLVNEEFLIRLFGARSPEAARVIETACMRPGGGVARTMVELTTDPILGSRLFASAAIESAVPPAITPAVPRALPELDGEEAEDEAAPAPALSRIFPQTHLDLTEAIEGDMDRDTAQVSRMDLPIPGGEDVLQLPSEDDWDIGLDDFDAGPPAADPAPAPRRTPKTEVLERTDDDDRGGSR